MTDGSIVGGHNGIEALLSHLSNSLILGLLSVIDGSIVGDHIGMCCGQSHTAFEFLISKRVQSERVWIGGLDSEKWDTRNPGP